MVGGCVDAVLGLILHVQWVYLFDFIWWSLILSNITRVWF